MSASGSEGADLEGRVRDLIESQGLIGRGERVVVAVSGGPDSVCLLHVLARIRAQAGADWTLSVAHLHHGLRGVEADADEAFVRALAAGLGLPVSVRRVDVPELVRETGRGIEDTARRERYRFFRALAEELGAGAVAVAHHADDVAETILLRLGRGAGLWGLHAMPASRPISRGSAVRLVRPLLGLRRSEILGYLDARGLPFRQDRTNQDLTYRRNLVRHRVLPDLAAALGEHLVETLAALNRQAGELIDDLDRRTWPLWGQCAVTGDPPRRIVISGAVWAAAGNLERKYLVHLASIHLCQSEPPVALSRADYDAVAGINPGTPTGFSLSLPGDMLLTIEHDGIVIETPATGEPGLAPPVPQLLNLDAPTTYTDFGLAVTAEVVENVGDAAAYARTHGGPLVAVLDAGGVPRPLQVRFRRRGDRFFPLGAPGEKKLKEFLIDRKVPGRLRDRIPLITGPARAGAPEEIVWVVSHQIADRCKCSAQTTVVLKLKAVLLAGR